MTVNHRKHFRNIHKDPKDDNVRESFDWTDTSRTIDSREGQRIRFNAPDGYFDLVDELTPQTFSFLLVPFRTSPLRCADRLWPRA